MITIEEFSAALERILKKVLTNKPEHPIAVDETFANYGLDSLDQMSMLLEIEDVIGVTIGELDTKLYNTPAKLHNYICNLPK